MLVLLVKLIHFILNNLPIYFYLKIPSEKNFKDYALLYIFWNGLGKFLVQLQACF